VLLFLLDCVLGLGATRAIAGGPADVRSLRAADETGQPQMIEQEAAAEFQCLRYAASELGLTPEAVGSFGVMRDPSGVLVIVDWRSANGASGECLVEGGVVKELRVLELPLGPDNDPGFICAAAVAKQLRLPAGAVLVLHRQTFTEAGHRRVTMDWQAPPGLGGVCEIVDGRLQRLDLIRGLPPGRQAPR
jgi:hypothetical protein